MAAFETKPNKPNKYLTLIKWLNDWDEGSETMEQMIHELKDMTYLSQAKISDSFGAAGFFLKAYEEGKIYYKRSNYDA